MQFLVDPGKKTDGTIGKGVAESLRFGGLQSAVASAVLPMLLCAFTTGAISCAIRCHGVLEGKKRVGRPAWWVAVHIIDMGSSNVIRIEEAHRPCDPEAPVTALSHYSHCK